MPVVAQGLFLRAGGITDPTDKPGISSLTAAMLTEGTATRTSQQISDEMEFLGAQLRASASREFTAIAAETLTSHWQHALEIMADVVQNATFPAQEFDRVRSDRLTDLSRIADSPQAIASRASQALLFGAGTRYGHPVSGTEAAVKSLTRDDLAAHHAATYAPEDATLILVGDISRDEAIQQAEAAFGGWQPCTAPVSERSSGQRISGRHDHHIPRRQAPARLSLSSARATLRSRAITPTTSRSTCSTTSSAASSPPAST